MKEINHGNPSLAKSPKPFATRRRQKRIVSSSVRDSVRNPPYLCFRVHNVFSNFNAQKISNTNKQNSEGGSEKTRHHHHFRTLNLFFIFYFLPFHDPLLCILHFSVGGSHDDVIYKKAN